MAHNVLTRLQKAKNKEVSGNADMADKMYGHLMSDIKIRAREDARKDAALEIEAANAKVHRVEAERDAAKVLQTSADGQVSELKSEIARLRSAATGMESDLQAKTRFVAVSKQDLADQGESLKADVASEQLKVHALELQIAELTGRLSAPKKTTVSKVANMPMTIPSFDIKPIRGQDGKIASATITPMGLN